MAHRIQGPSQARNVCGPKDTTAPPTPQVRILWAFDRAKDDAQVVANSPPATSLRPVRDPAYIELANVQVGTKIQILNLSQNPAAQWNDDTSVVELQLTGRDVRKRQASLYLTHEQMEKLDLKAGDVSQLRAVDQAGNASGVVTAELEPNDWARRELRERTDAGRL